MKQKWTICLIINELVFWYNPQYMDFVEGKKLGGRYEFTTFPNETKMVIFAYWVVSFILSEKVNV